MAQKSYLQLEWVGLREASLRSLRPERGPRAIGPHVSAIVTYAIDGDHLAELTISSAKKAEHFEFSVTVMALFSIDWKIFDTMFPTSGRSMAPREAALNITQIMYSSGRDILATLSARSIHGATFLEALTISHSDIIIRSKEPQKEVLEKYFGIVAPKKRPRLSKPAEPGTEPRSPRRIKKSATKD